MKQALCRPAGVFGAVCEILFQQIVRGLGLAVIQNPDRIPAIGLRVNAVPDAIAGKNIAECRGVRCRVRSAEVLHYCLKLAGAQFCQRAPAHDLLIRQRNARRAYREPNASDRQNRRRHSGSTMSLLPPRIEPSKRTGQNSGIRPAQSPPCKSSMAHGVDVQGATGE